MTTIVERIRLRRDTAANWTSNNPTLASAEPGWEDNTGKIKIGDGTTAWTALPYRFSGGAGGSGYSYATTAVSYTETATSGEKIVTITATGQTVTLPTAVGNTAKLSFKLMVAGTATIDGAGVETIDTAPTATLSAQYAAITLISDNANWLII